MHAYQPRCFRWEKTLAVSSLAPICTELLKASALLPGSFSGSVKQHGQAGRKERRERGKAGQSNFLTLFLHTIICPVRLHDSKEIFGTRNLISDLYLWYIPTSLCPLEKLLLQVTMPKASNSVPYSCLVHSSLIFSI